MKGADNTGRRQAQDAPSVPMPHGVAVALLAPAVHHVASAHGIRVLSIKGEVLERQGLRAGRTASDVDILVDPAHYAALVRILGAHGWGDRDGRVFVDLPGSGTVLAPHARTLEHPDWPCHLDLHRYYPGFLRPAQEVFDLLWESREAVDLAHSRCWAPDPVDHWLLASLHVARSHDASQRRDLEEKAAGTLSDRFDGLIERALSLGAGGPLRDSLERLTGTRVDIPESERRLLAVWTRRIEAPGTLPDAFVEQFREARASTRIKLLLREAWPPPRSVRAFHDIDPGGLGLVRFYLRRLVVAPAKLAAYAGLGRSRPTRRTG